MFKKFLEGLAFGAGFAVSCIVVWWLGLFTFLPMTLRTRAVDVATQPASVEYGDEAEELPFHELPVDQQIETASVIALVHFEPSSDGKMRAVVSEILKKDPAVTFRYAVGDEYDPSSYYPRPSTNYGDGEIVFFVGSPPSMRLSMSYSGDRIRGLGDMPIALLREKAR
jgi:predicted secreted protein